MKERDGWQGAVSKLSTPWGRGTLMSCHSRSPPAGRGRLPNPSGWMSRTGTPERGKGQKGPWCEIGDRLGERQTRLPISRCFSFFSVDLAKGERISPDAGRRLGMKLRSWGRSVRGETWDGDLGGDLGWNEMGWTAASWNTKGARGTNGLNGSHAHEGDTR